MAVASLILSTALVLNTVMALIAQQTHQIGVLKAIGGTRTTILQIYLATVLAYGLLALVIAFPLGSLVAFYGSQAILSIYDIPRSVFEISTQAVIFQLLAALVAPPLAALGPILEGAKITVRQAFASYGVGTDFGSSWIERMVQRVGSALLPRRYAVALANTFRRKRRLVLTELVLVIAGALFLMLTAARSSTTATLDAEFARRRYGLTVRFDQSQLQDRATPMAAGVAGVEKAELVFGHPVTLQSPGVTTDQAGAHSQLIGVPLEDSMYQPLIIEGRWLQASDARAIVIGKDLAAKNHFKVGDIVTLDLAELGRSDWQIVGLHQDMATSQLGATNVYAPRDAIWQATNQIGWGSFLVVQTVKHDASSVSAVADQLQNLYRKANMSVTEIQSSPEERRSLDKQFGAVVNLLMMLAFLTAVVGGIGLVGALSINVIERTKEIGVLRAIGARSGTIRSMFVFEALVQVLLSWLIALPISLVCAPLLSNALGQIMLGTNLDYQYNYPAALVWLILILVLGLLASILPARSASRISVRASLAYE